MPRIMRWSVAVAALAGAISCSQHRLRDIDDTPFPISDDFVFYVQPQTIVAGDAAVLHWSIRGASTVVIDEASAANEKAARVGTFDAAGTLQVFPKEDTIYVISCDTARSHSCASATVRVRLRSKN